MSKKTKFNVHDIFMEGQNTVANRNLFVSSPLFAVFASIYNRAEGRVKVGLIKTIKSVQTGEEFVAEVPIVTHVGLAIGMIENTEPDYKGLTFSIYHSALNDYDFRSARLRTSNPKYLQNRLSRNSTHELAESFDSRLHRTLNVFNEIINGMVDNSIDKKFGGRLGGAPKFGGRMSNISDALLTFMARHFAGEIDHSQVPVAVRSDFNGLFNKYAESRDKFKSALKETSDMVATEKWVYLTNANNGVILGAIRPEPMAVALERYMDEGELPPCHTFNYIQASVPFKWYPSFDHIPDEYRQELEFSMVMLKAHTASEQMLPTREGEHFYHELGAYCLCRDRGVSVYVLTK